MTYEQERLSGILSTIVEGAKSYYDSVVKQEAAGKEYEKARIRTLEQQRILASSTPGMQEYGELSGILTEAEKMRKMYTTGAIVAGGAVLAFAAVLFLARR